MAQQSDERKTHRRSGRRAGSDEAQTVFTMQEADAPDIVLFWQRLPEFFRYPLHAEPLTHMVFWSLAMLVGALFSPRFVQLVAWLFFIRYAYEVLDETAIGRLDPDKYHVSSASGRDSLPYKQFAIFVALIFLLVFAARAGGLIYGAVLIFILLSLPASVINLTMTRSFWAGVNPLAAISVMTTIGLPYLALCAFLFLLFASDATLLALLKPHLPLWLIMPVRNFVDMYFTLIMFHMMGYVVYQNHQALGIDVLTPPNNARADGGEAPLSAEDAIGQLIGAGQIEEALDLAEDAQRSAPDDLRANARYHKLLALAGREDRLREHARTYLTLLLDKRRGDEALKLFDEMRARDADFAPEQPAQLLPLARALRGRRRFKEALVLLKGFDKRFPAHADIPAVYLFVAQVLSENLHQDAFAQQILNGLLAHYPDHPTRIEARQLLAVIAQMQAKPPAQQQTK